MGTPRDQTSGRKEKEEDTARATGTGDIILCCWDTARATQKDPNAWPMEESLRVLTPVVAAVWGGMSTTQQDCKTIMKTMCAIRMRLNASECKHTSESRSHMAMHKAQATAAISQRRKHNHSSLTMAPRGP